MVLQRWKGLLSLALLFLIGLLIVGCGQKGPLYLPKPTKTLQKAA